MIDPDEETWNRLQADLEASSRRLQKARVDEAEAFLLTKAADQNATDGRAARQAVISTRAELDAAEAAYWSAKCQLLAFANGRI